MTSRGGVLVSRIHLAWDPSLPDLVLPDCWGKPGTPSPPFWEDTYGI